MIEFILGAMGFVLILYVGAFFLNVGFAVIVMVVAGIAHMIGYLFGLLKGDNEENTIDNSSEQSE